MFSHYCMYNVSQVDRVISVSNEACYKNKTPLIHRYAGIRTSLLAICSWAFNDFSQRKALDQGSATYDRRARSGSRRHSVRPAILFRSLEYLWNLEYLLSIDIPTSHPLTHCFKHLPLCHRLNNITRDVVICKLISNPVRVYDVGSSPTEAKSWHWTPCF